MVGWLEVLGGSNGDEVGVLLLTGEAMSSALGRAGSPFGFVQTNEVISHPYSPTRKRMHPGFS